MEKGLIDLGASVNLLPNSAYKQLGLEELKPTTIILSLADRLVKIPKGTIEDVFGPSRQILLPSGLRCPRHRASSRGHQLCAHHPW